MQRSSKDRTFWLYAHLELHDDVHVGAQLEPTESVLGRAAPSPTKCPSHVHVSLIEAPEGFGWLEAKWANLSEDVRFLPLNAAAAAPGESAGRRQHGSSSVVERLLGLAFVATALLTGGMLLARRGASVGGWWSAPVDILRHEYAVVPPLPSGTKLRLADDSVWPAAAALCRWQSRHAELLHDTRVLELGAGSGAVGLFAAGLGARRVLLTDRPGRPLDELADAMARNRPALPAVVSVEAGALSWGMELPLVATAERFDWVLASDVTYAHEAIDELAATLAALLRGPSPPPRVIVSHEHRSARRDFGRAPIQRWDEHDGALGRFAEAAAAHRLRLALLETERPRGEVAGGYRRWTADLSIFEVTLAASPEP